MFNEDRLMGFLQPRRSHELTMLLADLITNVKAFAVKAQLDDDYIVRGMNATVSPHGRD
ncbi:MAG: hypothetical protein PHR28_11325 [candidate division Zixibacteria bacterium]|nr:hypothetical protein [candidate division Zixibacteria bacterium]